MLIALRQPVLWGLNVLFLADFFLIFYSLCNVKNDELLIHISHTINFPIQFPIRCVLRCPKQPPIITFKNTSSASPPSIPFVGFPVYCFPVTAPCRPRKVEGRSGEENRVIN